MFYDIVERKNAFLGYKNEKFKKSNKFFAKVVSPWVWFWSNRGQENVFSDIVERNNAFLVNKNKKFKKVKIWDFCRGASP